MRKIRPVPWHAGLPADLDSEREVIGLVGDKPIERYNIAPSTQMQLRHSTAGGLVLAAVRW